LIFKENQNQWKGRGLLSLEFNYKFRGKQNKCSRTNITLRKLLNMQEEEKNRRLGHGASPYTKIFRFTKMELLNLYCAT
jgi:hypothetical protein